jgi:hypothetical protein
MLLRQNPTVRSWIDIVISHMYPAESSVERRKREGNNAASIPNIIQ